MCRHSTALLVLGVEAKRSKTNTMIHIQDVTDLNKILNGAIIYIIYNLYFIYIYKWCSKLNDFYSRILGRRRRLMAKIISLIIQICTL